MVASTKVWTDGQAPQCEADDLNGFNKENSNLITASGEALSDADNQQTNKAVSHYAAGGDFYTDGGGANAYALSAGGSRIAPPAYFTGMRVRFFPSNPNTGASTINVAGLGLKDLTVSTGDQGSIAALPSAYIAVNRMVEAEYNGSIFIIPTGKLSDSTASTASHIGASSAAAKAAFDVGTAVGADLGDLETTVGSPNQTNMGPYTGNLIPSNETAKENIQVLETAVEAGTKRYALTRQGVTVEPSSNVVVKITPSLLVAGENAGDAFTLDGNNVKPLAGVNTVRATAFFSIAIATGAALTPGAHMRCSIKVENASDSGAASRTSSGYVPDISTGYIGARFANGIIRFTVDLGLVGVTPTTEFSMEILTQLVTYPDASFDMDVTGQMTLEVVGDTLA